MSPVPTTASLMSELSGRSHELGHAKREIQGLPPVEARIAEGLAAVELLLEHRLRAAEALRHVLARELEVNASRPRSDCAVSGEESRSSSMIESKFRVFVPLAVRTGLACIGSHAQTTGISVLRTASSSGGSESAPAPPPCA